jgi:hypothetical protein
MCKRIALVMLIGLVLATGCAGFQMPVATPAPSPAPTQVSPPTPEASPMPTVLPPGVIAQESGEIDADAGSELRISVDGRPGAAVAIDAEALSGSVDFQLSVADPFGNFLANVDDAGPGKPESISEFQFPYEGAYEVIVTPFAGAGKALVTVREAQGSPGVQELSGPGSFEAAMPEPHTYHAYRLALHAGEMVTIAARGTDGLDTRMALYGPDGRFIAMRDDDAGVDPVWTGFTPDADGTYTAIVSNFADSTGEYTFSLTGSGGGDLIYDSPLELSIEEGTDTDLTLNGLAGEVIRVEVGVVADDLDVDLELRLGDSVLAVADLAGRGADEILSEFRLPSDGEYTLRLIGFAGTGPATLLVRRLGEASGGGELTGGEDVLGGRFEDDLVYHVFTFDGEEGQSVDLVVDTTDGNPDAFLTLVGPDGEELASSDDTDGDLDPSLEGFALPATGQYMVLIHNLHKTHGSYDLIFSLQ